MATTALPTVSAKSSIEATATLVVKTDEKVTIALSDVETLIQAQLNYTLANKKVGQAETARDNARLVLFGKLVGVKTLDELKQLSQPEFSKRMQQRAEAGLLSFADAEAAKFLCEEKHQVRPSWEKAFLEACGELKANAVRAATPPTYSWSVKKP